MNRDLEATLRYCRDLFSPPAIALRIIEMARNPETDLAVIARTVSLDPALSQRLLRVSNSSLYAGRRKVETLNQAMTLLGLNATMTLALGFSLARDMRDSAGERAALWCRSVLGSLAARLLGVHVRIDRLEELMLAGLLQDIGAMALLKAIPERYAPLRARAPDNTALLALEREAFGCDHAEVGAWLARQWELPQYLQDAIAASEDPSAEDPFAACVIASGAIAELWLDRAGGASEARARALVQALPLHEGTTLDTVLAEMHASLPEISTLFETQIPHADHLDGLIAEARELLVMRNLRMIQSAAASRRDADKAAEHIRRLAEQARRDPLTGVYNRLEMDEALEREFALALELGQPLSVAFIDLDEFKRINDEHGHLVGDQVLRQFATSLQEMLRANDIVARYGGEEFLVVLGNSGQAAATMILQRILEQVRRLPMATVDDRPLYVTFSAGIATHDADTRFPDAGSILRAADEALYGAKRDGRNRVGRRPS
ncbi:GGDEF domain-containing protein [Luteimonas granuli]|uniref:diguanylate cyclase n=1 Tax=Luteimonas granuli TaxID=1176533 RepID=A0A518N7A1_9GAMM|nr:GGDEF domain-containing protein [Luteimonas granuli]QDW67788.1 GGDEF domain-containing protein [Luteimonas granuli]